MRGRTRREKGRARRGRSRGRRPRPSRSPRGARGGCPPRMQDRRGREGRQRREQEAGAPAGLPVPRPPSGRRGEKRERRGREGEREAPVAPVKEEEPGHREDDDRRVPEKPLVGEQREAEESREERVRERLARVPAAELAEPGEFEEEPEKENSCERKKQGPWQREGGGRIAPRRARVRVAPAFRPREPAPPALLPSTKSLFCPLPPQRPHTRRRGATARSSSVFVRIAKPAAAPRATCQRREPGDSRSSTSARTVTATQSAWSGSP